MTVRLNFYDILRQNEDFKRSISENAITDSETNISTIYFMAHLAYSFSSFGTKKETHKHCKQINQQNWNKFKNNNLFLSQDASSFIEE